MFYAGGFALGKLGTPMKPGRMSSGRNVWLLAAMVCVASVLGFCFTGQVRAQTVTKPVASKDAPLTLDSVLSPVVTLLERANREYQETVVEGLSVPTGKTMPPSSSGSVKDKGQTSTAQTLLDQVKSFVGLQPSLSQPPSLPSVSAPSGQSDGDGTRQRELAVQRQMEARQLEVQRNLEQQRLAVEASKYADTTDAATRLRQKQAEVARTLEEMRRNGQAIPPAPTVLGEADKPRAVQPVRPSTTALLNPPTTQIIQPPVAAPAVPPVRVTQAPGPPQTTTERPIEPLAGAPEPSKPTPPKPSTETPKALDRTGTAQRPAAPSQPAVPVDKIEAGRMGDAASQAMTKALERDRSDKKARSVALDGKGTFKAKSGKCARAGRDVDLPATYVVQRGDTLWDISRRHYNHGHRFEKILRANASKIASPDMIFPCQKFYLPGRSAFFWVLPDDAIDAS